MKTIRTLVSLVAVLVVTSVAAHEGHVHSLRGTVTAVKSQASQFEMKEVDGKTTITVTVTPETRYFKGSEAASLSDVTPGSRIVVSARQEAGGVWKAVEVRLPAPKAPAGDTHAPPPQGHH